MFERRSLFLVSLAILFTSCATIHRFVPLVEHPIRRASVVSRVDSPELLTYPLMGGLDDYQIIKRHFESSGGNFYLFSTTIHEDHSSFLLLARFDEILTIVKFVEEDGSSFYALYHDYCSGPGIPTPPKGIVIEADSFLFTEETDLESGSHCYLVPYVLTKEVVNELKGAKRILIDPWPHASEAWVRYPTALTLDEYQRAVLQSFFVHTENLSYRAP